MSEEGEETHLSQWVLVGPMCSKLATVKTSVYGPRMETTKKTKMIVEKSSFQKVQIWHSFEISKLGSRFGVKGLFYPFGPKLGFLGLKQRQAEHKS